jgi:hypothetical protein
VFTCGMQVAADGQNDLLVGESMVNVSSEAANRLLRGERVTLTVPLSNRSSYMHPHLQSGRQADITPLSCSGDLLQA